jgi:hypothetical protein
MPAAAAQNRASGWQTWQLELGPTLGGQARRLGWHAFAAPWRANLGGARGYRIAKVSVAHFDS